MVLPVTVGLDIAKNVFHAYGVEAHGAGRGLLCHAGAVPVRIEACATAHYWARTIEKLGREVRPMPPAYAKSYVRTRTMERMPRQSLHGW